MHEETEHEDGRETAVVINREAQRWGGFDSGSGAGHSFTDITLSSTAVIIRHYVGS
jgi:hypothetical protein